MIDKLVLQKAIDTWGKDGQVRKLQEELLELALAISHLNCTTKNQDKMLDNIYDELADVKIMMAQMDLVFDPIRINSRIAYKMNRLEKLLK